MVSPLSPADGAPRAGLALPPGTLSWGVAARAAHLGAFLPSFVRATDTLAYLTGLAISPREMELCTEGLGAAYTLPELPRGVDGPPADVVYVEADAVQVHFRETPPWHEEKVFCVWREVEGVAQPPRYAAARGAWFDHLALLQTLAEREGLRRARVVVCLGDGAPPLWDLFHALAPDAVQILDWYHVQEHLAAVARLLPDGAAWHAGLREHLLASRVRAAIRSAAGGSSRRASRWCSNAARGPACAGTPRTSSPCCVPAARG